MNLNVQKFCLNSSTRILHTYSRNLKGLFSFDDVSNSKLNSQRSSPLFMKQAFFEEHLNMLNIATQRWLS